MASVPTTRDVSSTTQVCYNIICVCGERVWGRKTGAEGKAGSNACMVTPHSRLNKAQRECRLVQWSREPGGLLCCCASQQLAAQTPGRCHTASVLSQVLACILYNLNVLLPCCRTAAALLLQASKPMTSTSSPSQPLAAAGSLSSPTAHQQHTRSQPHHPASQHGVVQVCHVLHSSLCWTVQLC
jgi:hypothetical protein